MSMKKCNKWLPLIFLMSILTACGGGGGGDSTSETSASGDSVDSGGASATIVQSGIAVDPYIFNARFDEIDAEGNILQTSGYSSSEGAFTFSNALSDGSTIQSRNSASLPQAQQAQHAGELYTGVIKRQVSIGELTTGESLVVSPLTTLLANGMLPDDIISMLDSAGISVPVASIHDDPMAFLVNQTGSVSSGDLVLLQANMAVSAYMEALQNFDYPDTGSTTTPGTGAGGGTAPSTPDGQSIFTNICSNCHNLGASTSIMNLSGDGAKVTNQFGGGAIHNNNTLTADEITAVAAYLNGQTTTMNTGVSIAAVSAVNFSDIAFMVKTSLNPSLYAQMVNAYGSGFTVGDMANTAANVNHSMIQQMVNSKSPAVPMKTVDQILAVAGDVYHSRTGTPPPDTGTGGGTTPGTPDGQAIFTSICSNCHTLDTSTSIMNLAGDGAKVSNQFGGGATHNGNNLTADQISAVETYLNSQGGTTPPPDTGTGGDTTPACGSCHSLPPSGNSFPNGAGAHAVHADLSGVGTVCDNCHANAVHRDDWIDLGFAAGWNAKSGAATDNGDGTCSNIICHGGRKTPDWGTGSINVSSQCQSCHSYGTNQYNSYNSGKHNKHVNGEHISCSECHDLTKLASGHFDNLSTPGFEQLPSSTLKNALNYNNQRCSLSCHGEGHNSERW